MITIHNFSVEAAHFLGRTRYLVENLDEVSMELFRRAIPPNLMSLDREGLVPVCEHAMQVMNTLWSSTGGIPTFPEVFGEHTKLSQSAESVYMSGKGWSVAVYNGDMATITKKRLEAIDKLIATKTLSDVEKADRVAAILGPLPTPVGR